MYTPSKNKMTKLDTTFSTPRETMNFSQELRQVLQEKNLLTAKSRMKVCSMLDSSIGESNEIKMPLANSNINRRKNFRLQAVSEIISSEHAYLKQLEVLMEYFVNPLKEQSIINDATHTTIFGQLEMIYNLNRELLSELECNQTNVSQAFLKIAPFLKLYSVYAFDYKNSLLLVQDLVNKNPLFHKFLQKTESRPEVQKKLNSLMIAPIQRVPRYKLLLEQVLLYTSPSDGDFKQLKDAIKEVESTASHINSCIADQEVTQKLINLQNSLTNRTPNIVKPSRRVIKEGVLLKITRTGSGAKRYCVLMSDIFMYCKMLKDRDPNTVVENSLECSCIFPLKKSKVYELFPGNFKITCQGDGIIFGTADLSLGRTWVGFIRDAIDMHIECRRTLRKESSKRKPIRKKDMKSFGADYVLSPNTKRCDFETVFRNSTYNSDTEEDEASTNCLNFVKSTNPKNAIVSGSSSVELRKGVKRKFENRTGNFVINKYRSYEENRISKLYKFITTKNENCAKSILKRTAPSLVTEEITNSDPTYSFNNQNSEVHSFFCVPKTDRVLSTSKVDNDEVTDLKRDGNPRYVLFPLGKSENSLTDSGTKDMGIQNNTLLPPKQKRVKFDESQDLCCNREAHAGTSYKYSTEAVKISLRQRIYDFFANLF